MGKKGEKQTPATSSIGVKYGRLIVLGIVGHDKGGKARVRCQCDCGAVVPNANLDSIRRGTSTSCGCYQREGSSERIKKICTTHGLCGRYHQEYAIWQMIRQRTMNPQCDGYEDYGFQFIRMSYRWRNGVARGFANFIADMGPRPGPEYSVDRIDPDGPYSEWNTRWADHRTQALNRLCTHWVTFKGKTLCLRDFAKEVGIPEGTLRGRLKRGWSVERALTEPSSKLITVNGKSLTLAGWARELGVGVSTINARIHRRGWSAERALTTPVQKQFRSGHQHQN
jgi:hypothetical protein